jgi:CheY-like chemotaxis protein
MSRLFQLKPILAKPTLPGDVLRTTWVLPLRPRRAGLRRDRMDIVIYEQDDLTHALLRQWLSEAGYRVHIGAPCKLGRRADLVIVDIYMPKQAGAQCVRGIQAAHPDTPLIAISAQFRPGLSAAGAAAQTLGVQQVIAKPLARTQLLEAVQAMIGPPD